MKKEYPQEHIGTTAFAYEEAGERRRVYTRMKGDLLEVSEFTCGPLTQDIYGAPAHVHCVYVEEEGEDEARAFFQQNDVLLADYMDDLDARGVRYGYLDSQMGKFVSYRPA